MPSTSKVQQRTMQAAAHDPAFAAKIDIPQSVAKDFNMADKAAGNVGKAADLPARAPARFKEHRRRGMMLAAFLFGLAGTAWATSPTIEEIGVHRIINGGTGAETAAGAVTNLGISPHVATNAALAAASAADYSAGVWRDHYTAGGVADGPLFFGAQTGTCAANGWVNDGGMCVNDAGTNSFKALHIGGALNIKEFGARGDNSTDDTAAIQAAINAAGNATPGYYQTELVCPAGNYKINTPGGVSITTPQMQVRAHGYCAWITTIDSQVLTINALQVHVDGLLLVGYNSPTATKTTLTIGSGCVECIVSRAVLAYGFRAIDNAGADSVVELTKAGSAYGPSLVRTVSGNWWRRDKFDQPYPYGIPPAAGYTLSPWAGTHAYVAGDLVTIGAGAWMLQATVGGTSGGSAPAVAAYGTNIPDGGVTWQLAAPATTYYSFNVDTGAAAVTINDLDATGTFTYPIAITNSLAGVEPQLLVFKNVNAGQGLSGGILIAAGANIQFIGGSSTNCVLAGCNGAYVSPGGAFSNTLSFTGGFTVRGGGGNPTGINFSRGSGLVVSSAAILGQYIGVYFGPNKNSASIINNDFSTGEWGTTTFGVDVETGTGDYYNIIGNICNGVTTCVLDGGTGTHKTVSGNNDIGLRYNNGVLLVSPTAPTIASGGCTTGAAQSISASNGSAAFQVTLGGATCGSTITLTMPAAPTSWVCDAHNITTPASNKPDMTGVASPTAVVLTNYVRTTGVAGNFTGADKLSVKCLPY